jgi:hypothetical protein
LPEKCYVSITQQCAHARQKANPAMSTSNLQPVADGVLQRAKRQGYVLPREVREELARAGLAEDLWKDVVELVRSELRCRNGRWYWQPPVSERVRQEQSQQQAIRKAIRQIVRQQAAEHPDDRRAEGRIDFIQPITVRTDDGREHHLLSRDLSPTGIRLIGTRHLLGQKVDVLIPRPGEGQPWSFRVRVLWTCSVGDDLFENGGVFLAVLP